jgi:pyruvate dehydrogenase E2 component (dihydrolipoamide acetyltransferase)
MRPVEMTPMRRAIARRMVASKQQAPHFYVSTELELDAPLADLERRNAGAAREQRISVTALLAHAAARALREHPGMNAVWEGDELMVADEVNLGVAIALEDGLVAPAVLGADTLSLAETATALRELVGRARDRRLGGAEMTGATFTLSNLGMFEVTSFIPIVTPPQVAILATGKVNKVPRIAGGELVERSLVTATVSADHRAVDGADVARFLETLKRLVEHPEDEHG